MNSQRNKPFQNMGFNLDILSNISIIGCSLSSPDETPRRELKIRRAAEFLTNLEVLHPW